MIAKKEEGKNTLRKEARKVCMKEGMMRVKEGR